MAICESWKRKKQACPKVMVSAGRSKSNEPRPPIAWSLLLALAAVKLFLHVVSSAWVAYGWVGDEFYFLDCAGHLDWGYVDHPPLSIAVLRLWTELLGSSMLAVRLVPALAGCTTIVFAGLMARELGGGRIAQGLAGLGVLAGPVYLAMGSFYSMNPIDQTLWAVAAYFLLRLVNSGNPRIWLGLGVVRLVTNRDPRRGGR